jgi:hypothetical protein
VNSKEDINKQEFLMKNLKIKFLALSALLISSISCSAAAALEQNKLLSANPVNNSAYNLIGLFPEGNNFLSGNIYKKDISEHPDDGYNYFIDSPVILNNFKAFAQKIAPYVKIKDEGKDVIVDIAEMNENSLTLTREGRLPLKITKEQIKKMFDKE